MSESGFIQEPMESDRLVTKGPIYYDEPGKKRAKASQVTLHPCATCGVQVIDGQLESGELVLIEPDTMMYTMVWYSGEHYPTLLQSRGYPAHQCRSQA